MENLQLAVPELPARRNLGRRRTGAPAAATDNGDRARLYALAIPGESVVVDAVEVSDSILRAKAMARHARAVAAPMPKATRLRRLAGTLAAWYREVAARRTILVFRTMPDDRLARAGLDRADLIAQIREKFGFAERRD